MCLSSLWSYFANSSTTVEFNYDDYSDEDKAKMDRLPPVFQQIFARKYKSDFWSDCVGKYSILGTVLVVFVFFAFTVWRVARFPENQWAWDLLHSARRELHQIPAQLPFTFKILEGTVNAVNKFGFNLCCLEHPESIVLIWAADVSYIFKIINETKTWELLNDLGNQEETDGDPPNDSEAKPPFLHVQRLSLTRPEDDKFEYNINVETPPSLKWESLSNQYKYPLAIFISKSQEDISSSDSPNIVGLCAILHVKNPLIPKPTEILAQYIKLSNGQAHHLQNLFVDASSNPGEDSEDEDEAKNTEKSQKASEESSESKENEPFKDVLCIVCQTLPVSRAIIPCRHVCLCARCFGKLNVCPICRGIIQYYFKTRGESYMEELPVEAR